MRLSNCVLLCGQAEEAGPEEEVRAAVELRRLSGDGGGGERRGRHAVRGSQPPQVRGQLRMLCHHHNYNMQNLSLQHFLLPLAVPESDVLLPRPDL